MKAKIVYTNHINWKMIFTQQLFYQQIKTANEYVGVGDRLYFPATSSGLLPCIPPQNNECIFSSSVRAFLLSYMVCVTNVVFVYMLQFVAVCPAEVRVCGLCCLSFRRVAAGYAHLPAPQWCLFTSLSIVLGYLSRISFDKSLKTWRNFSRAFLKSCKEENHSTSKENTSGLLPVFNAV